MQVITASNINSLLRIVTDITDNGSEQLSLLACTLVAACHACSVPKENALQVVAQLFDEQQIAEENFSKRVLN